MTCTALQFFSGRPVSSIRFAAASDGQLATVEDEGLIDYDSLDAKDAWVFLSDLERKLPDRDRKLIDRLSEDCWFHDPGELKNVMAEHNITWRSFDDENVINLQWNSPATPTFYIIDHEGVIRHKWIGKPGEDSVDKALDRLILETEQATSAK